MRFRFIQFVLVYTMLKSADPNQILSSCARGDGSGEPHHVLIGMGHVTTSYAHGDGSCDHIICLWDGSCDHIMKP